MLRCNECKTLIKGGEDYYILDGREFCNTCGKRKDHKNFTKIVKKSQQFWMLNYKKLSAKSI